MPCLRNARGLLQHMVRLCCHSAKWTPQEHLAKSVWKTGRQNRFELLLCIRHDQQDGHFGGNSKWWRLRKTGGGRSTQNPHHRECKGQGFHPGACLLQIARALSKVRWLFINSRIQDHMDSFSPRPTVLHSKGFYTPHSIRLPPPPHPFISQTLLPYHTINFRIAGTIHLASAGNHRFCIICHMDYTIL